MSLSIADAEMKRRAGGRAGALRYGLAIYERGCRLGRAGESFNNVAPGAMRQPAQTSKLSHLFELFDSAKESLAACEKDSQSHGGQRH